MSILWMGSICWLGIGLSLGLGWLGIAICCSGIRSIGIGRINGGCGNLRSCLSRNSDGRIEIYKFGISYNVWYGMV